jgi:hypothetical protein
VLLTTLAKVDTELVTPAILVAAVVIELLKLPLTAVVVPFTVVMEPTPLAMEELDVELVVPETVDT